jgi:hypothetical protein
MVFCFPTGAPCLALNHDLLSHTDEILLTAVPGQLTTDPYKYEQGLHKAIWRVFALNNKAGIINEFSNKV